MTTKDQAPLEPKDIIRRLCKLQAEVSEYVGYQHAADCFCGEGGFWDSDNYDGTYAGGYRNDGKSLEFIEQAVREKLNTKDQANVQEFPEWYLGDTPYPLHSVLIQLIKAAEILLNDKNYDGCYHEKIRICQTQAIKILKQIGIRAELIPEIHKDYHAQSLTTQLADSKAENERLQAQIDRLMLEYCPDEMTDEQKDNWAKHQRAASASVEDELEQALNGQGDIRNDG